MSATSTARYLEVRRHTMRVKPGDHLSQAGVALARRTGDEMGPFDLVITSTLPRAFETALAMGFAVHEQMDVLATMDDEVDAEIAWDAGFSGFARAIQRGKATARFAYDQAGVWESIGRRLPEGGRALLISHGGIVEAGAVACLPRVDHARWGACLDYCEGVRLSFDGDIFTSIKILRVQ